MENETVPKENRSNLIHCPDCEKEYPKPHPGKYQCIQCYCKFIVEENSAITIIPFFDEMSFGPIMVMLFVLGVVLLAAMGNNILPFTQRLNFFLIAVLLVFATYKGINILCRRYRGVDRFLRKISRPPFMNDDPSLIKISHKEKDD